jgi:hypothetical protein
VTFTFTFDGVADLPHYDVRESHFVISDLCITPTGLFTGYIDRHVSIEQRMGVRLSTCSSEGFFSTDLIINFVLIFSVY